MGQGKNKRQNRLRKQRDKKQQQRERHTAAPGTGSWSLVVAALPPWIQVSDDPSAVGLVVVVYDEVAQLVRCAVPTDDYEIGNQMPQILETARRGEALPPGAPDRGRWPRNLYVWPETLAPLLAEEVPTVTVSAREPNPAIGEFIQGMLEQLAPTEPQLYRASLSDALLSAADRMAQREPWRHYADHVVLELERTDGGADPRFKIAALLGAADQVYGIALYPDLDAWHRVAEASVNGVMPDDVESLALYFHDDAETPPIDQQHFAARGYTPTHLFPVLMHVKDGDIVMLGDDEVSAALEAELATLSEAVLAWHEAHPEPAADQTTLDVDALGARITQHILTPPEIDPVAALQPLVPHDHNEPRAAAMLTARDALRSLAQSVDGPGAPPAAAFDALPERVATLVLRNDPARPAEATSLVEADASLLVFVEAPPPPPELEVAPFSYSLLLTTAEYAPAGVLTVLDQPTGAAIDDALEAQGDHIVVIAANAPAGADLSALPDPAQIVWMGVLGVLDAEA